MKKLIKSQLFLQVIVASMVATLATAGIVAASTTIGTNVNTGGTLDVSGVSTLASLAVTGGTTLTGALTANGTSALNNTVTVAAGKGLILGSSATAITGASAGMIYYDSGAAVVKLYDGSSWYTIGTSTDGVTLSGSRLQLDNLNYYAAIGTTTQQGLSVLTVEATSTAAIPFTLVARSSQTANLFQIMNSSSSNLLYANSAGGLFATSTLQVTGATTLYNDLTVDTNTLFVGSSANRVGIGTTTPFASLSINNIAGDNAFVIGSSTATWLKVDASGLLTVAKAATFSNNMTVSGAIGFDSASSTAAGTALIRTGTLTATTNIGAASSTPTFQLGIGTGQATSTISMGKFCMFAEQENGVGVYLRLGSKQPNNQPFATSTIPCNQ